jgi:hypothetical protein
MLEILYTLTSFFPQSKMIVLNTLIDLKVPISLDLRVLLWVVLVPMIIFIIVEMQDLIILYQHMVT